MGGPRQGQERSGRAEDPSQAAPSSSGRCPGAASPPRRARGAGPAGRGGAEARALQGQRAAALPRRARARPRPAPPPPRSLARSLLPALPAAPAEPASPQSLMNIERPLLYFPNSIAEAQARHIVRRRRRPRRLVPESCSSRGQRSPGPGQAPVSEAAGEAKGAGAEARDVRRLGRWLKGGPVAGEGCVSAGVCGEMASPPPADLGAGMAGEAVLIVPVSSRVLAEVGESVFGGPGGQSSGVPSLAANLSPCALQRGGRGCGAAPSPPGLGPQPLPGPFPEANGVECEFFCCCSPPPGFPLAVLACLHRGGGVERFVQVAPSPRGAGVGARVGRRSSASGFPAGCGETPPGSHIPGVPPACSAVSVAGF